MALMFLPTNVRLPTLLDDLRAEYLAGEIDADAFECGVGQLLEAGTADDVSPACGRIGLAWEWR